MRYLNILFQDKYCYFERLNNTYIKIKKEKK